LDKLIFLLIILPIIFYIFYKKKTQNLTKFQQYLKYFSLVISSSLWLFLISGSFYFPQHLIVNNYHLINNNLPKLKIALISDLHVGPYRKKAWIQQIVNKLNNIPNLEAVFIPGDFIFGGIQFTQELAPLKNLKIPIIFATLGNHDHYPTEPLNSYTANGVSQALKKFNIPELKNQSYFWQEKNIYIVGLDDNDLKYHDLDQAFKNIPQNSKKILLAHSPDIIDELTFTFNPNLILSGHTHCGQVRLPLLGAIPGTIPTKYGKQLEKHHYQINKNQDLFITCGTGEVGTRLRTFNFPEISVLSIN